MMAGLRGLYASAKARLAALVHEAEAALASFGRRADTLIEAVRFAVNRKR